MGKFNDWSIAASVAVQQYKHDLKQPGNNSNKRAFKAYVKEIIIVLLIYFGFTCFIATPVVVAGSSMYPTLQDGEVGLSSLIDKSVERFDIVVVWAENKYIVKRVVGLPGETISCKDETIYIDGKAIEEDFLDESYTSQFEDFTSDFEEVTLGNDEYFLLGDNRNDSKDSRYYGAFKKDDIKSVGFFGLWPLNDFGKTE